jgi:uncharacterized protein involved in exopolysaccharide biosynthesis
VRGVNKTLEPFLRDRRLRFAAAVVPDSAGTEREAEPHVAAIRRPIRNILRRRIGFVAAVALGGTILAGAAAIMVPPSFTATAQLIVEPTAAEMAAALIGPVLDTHITTLTADRRLRAVLTERAAAQAARAAKPEQPSLDGQLRAVLTGALAAVKAALRPAEDEPVPAGQPPAPDIGSLRDSLLVRQERLSSILAVSARSRDPEEAAATVNRLVTLHVEELSERKQRETAFMQSELDAQIASTRAELSRAEDALKAFQAATGLSATSAGAPDENADLIADVQRQLGVARDELRERELRVARTSPDARPDTLPDGGSAVPSEDQGRRLEDAYEVRALGLRAGRLELRLRDLQAKSSLAFRQRLDQQALELRIASARKRLDDLLQRRQDESKESSRRFAAEARVFALASVPTRPSSVSPFLMLPPAAVAFTVLGIALALLRERMDRSLRNEREVEEILGIPCLGHIPRTRRLEPADRERAYDAVARVLTQICDSGHGVRVVLVTAARDAANAEQLAAGLSGGLTRAGHRVLAMELTESLGAGRAEGKPAGEVEGEAAPLTTRGPDQPFDRLADGAQGAALILNRSGAPFKSLGDRYDYVIVNAPPALGAIQTRLVAAKADGVVLGIGWGVTPRETASEALHALRRSAPLVGEFDINAVAVLTEVDPRRYARFQPGHA